jgi:hypothetical protein
MMALPSSHTFSRDMRPFLNSHTWSMRNEIVLPFPGTPRNSPDRYARQRRRPARRCQPHQWTREGALHGQPRHHRGARGDLLHDRPVPWC